MVNFLKNLISKTHSKINIYADESSIDNPKAKNMVIGAVFMDRSKVPAIKEKVGSIRKKHSLNGELKWTKTSRRTLVFYKDLFDYLFSLDEDIFSFKCIVVKKEDVDYKKYHNEDKELAFYKFYFQLLKNRLEKENEYYILLDFKPSKSKDRVRRIGEFLGMVNPDTSVRHIQAYSSKDNVFIQIADVLSGAVGYIKNYEKNSVNKSELLKVIATAINKDDLDFCSKFKGDKKFNIFCIKPGYKSGS